MHDLQLKSGRTRHSRPLIVKVLLALFVIGGLASFLSAVSLTFPGSFPESIWRFNPHARAGFDRTGSWAIILMLVVCVACVLTTIGLWRGSRWGYWLCLIMLTANLMGDLVNVITGTEPRAVVGIPIVLFIFVLWMRRKTREYFARTENLCSTRQGIGSPGN